MARPVRRSGPGLPPGLRVILGGGLVPLARARVSVLDRGILFGDGLYETLRTYGGRPFRLDAHLDRLAVSAARLDLRLPAARGAFARAVTDVVRANRLVSARVRITVTRGSGAPDLGVVAGARPTWLVHAVPYEPPAPAAYARGVAAILATVARNHRRSLDPAIKSTNLLNNWFALREAARAGAREAILLNPDGDVAEAASANVFFVRRGELCTPSLACGILPGVTRALVLDLARRLGVRVREGRFPARALATADEAFVTASTIEVLPLASLGRRVYPARRPLTRLLQTAYRVTVRDELGV